MNDKYDFFDIERLQACAELALQAARDEGADAAETDVGAGTGMSVTVRLGEVEAVERQRDRSLGITLYFGQHKGVATTTEFDADAIRRTARAAADIARYTAEDPYAGLAPAERMATHFPDLDLCHPWNLSPEGAIDLATRCEAAARGTDARIVNSEGASVDTAHDMVVYANTHGFVGVHEETRHDVSCSVVAGDGSGMQRDVWYTTARAAEDLEDTAQVGREAAHRALARLGAKPLSTRKARILFAPKVARNLVGRLLLAITGPSQYRQASFLLGAAGRQVMPDWTRLVERPHLPRAAGSRVFDAEGVATADKDIIDGGTLAGYLLDSYSARRLGLETTGHAGGISNLLVEPGGEQPDAPLSALDTGLYVTELIGQGVNPVTGDYSRGAAGFWVEHGEIVHPVEEVTIAGNLKDMLAGIVTIGADIDTRGNIRTGSILIDRMTIAGE